ncbi:MAG TPA: hypothetical protein VFV10_14890, partial [Gammaproteobacteria bacterium]|nr:hypothetical protein [Gammaproteobacteria bacterium]
MTTRIRFRAVAAAAILALPACGMAQNVRAQSSSAQPSSPEKPTEQKPMELTALDYIEIQQLVAKYARAIDTCSNNGYDYA